MAVEIRYLNPASTPGGNGKSPLIDPPNPEDRAYASMVEWESAEQKNDPTEDHILECVAGVDSGAVLVDGWNVNSITIRAYAGSEHGGAAGSGYVLTSALAVSTLEYRENIVAIEDIEINNTYTGGAASRAIFQNVQASGTAFKNLLISQQGTRVGVWQTSTASPSSYDGCCFHDAAGSGTYGIFTGSNVTTTIRNCTFVDQASGALIVSSGVSATAHNSVAYGPSGWPDPKPGGDYNASSTPTAPGLNSQVNIPATSFTDYAAGDFTIRDEASPLYDNGEAANRPAADITGTAWVTNDIGCFAFVGGAPPEDQIINLPGLQLDADPQIPTISTAVKNQINLPGLQLDADPQIPTINAGADQIVFLNKAVDINVDPQIPLTNAVAQHQVNLPALQLDTDPAIPRVTAGADAVVTLEAAVVIDADPQIPIIFGALKNIVDVPALQIDANPQVPTVEGVSDLPPTITVPTGDQTYTFGANGVLPAPPHDVGTGDTPVWSMPVEDFSTKPGVLNWTINPTTGDITYSIQGLTTNADVQALNTKGPYTTTRRLTTTVAHVDETFKIYVNVGNYTLQQTPGTPHVTWITRTPGARGVEAGMDPSARVTQTYTVT